MNDKEKIRELDLLLSKWGVDIVYLFETKMKGMNQVDINEVGGLGGRNGLNWRSKEIVEELWCIGIRRDGFSNKSTWDITQSQLYWKKRVRDLKSYLREYMHLVIGRREENCGKSWLQFLG